MTPRVIVAGSINMDIVVRVARHPSPGETLAGHDLAYFPGGKGANQAVAAARAGASVVMLGAVGDDARADEVLAFLAANAVDVESVARRDGVATGTALVLIDATGENEIVVVAGANATLDEAVIESVAPRGDVLVAQFETPIGSTVAFFGRGRAAGAFCVLNPAPAGDIPDELLRLVDLLVVNETEAADSSVEALRARGFGGSLVVTLGARGSTTVTPDSVIEVPGLAVPVVDSTAAGDCFCGYICASVANGADLERALVTANRAASLCVQRPGAGPSIPTRAEVDAST